MTIFIAHYIFILREKNISCHGKEKLPNVRIKLFIV